MSLGYWLKMKNYKTYPELNRLITKEFLQENYIIRKISVAEIARKIGCDVSCVKLRLDKFGFPIRSYSEAFKGRKQTEEWKKNIGKANKGKIKPEGWGKKHGELMKGHVFSEERARKILQKVCASPNKFELKCLDYLNKLYPNKFKYCGDGSTLINKRSPDFISEELKVVVLAHGYYYHLRIKGLEVTEENKRSVEKIDSLPFLQAGYRVMFVWEDELNNLLG